MDDTMSSQRCAVCGNQKSSRVVGLYFPGDTKKKSYICSIYCLETVAEQQALLDNSSDATWRDCWHYAGLALPLSAYFRALPDDFLVLGKDHSPIRVFLESSSAPVSFPSDLDRLASLCEQAPFGRGKQTVIDTNVRRVLETDRCRIEWEGMAKVLGHIAEKLGLPQSIRAEFYKVLLYREDDFFLEHMDSKKSADHTLTLAVDVSSDCSGGDLVFPVTSMSPTALITSNDFLVAKSPAKEELRWMSNGGIGSYACWFTAQKHSVTKVKRGFRVVALYNVVVPDVAEFKPQLHAPQLPGASSSGELLLQLPADVLRLIVGHLVRVGGLGIVARLARTCKALRGLMRNRGWLLAEWITGRRSLLLRVISETCCNSLGFVLQHKYSFDGKSELPLCRLRGRDRTLAEAFLASGLGKVCVRPVFVRMEKRVREGANENDVALDVPEFRIARAITRIEPYNYYRLSCEENAFMPFGFEAEDHTTGQILDHTASAWSETDNDSVHERFWPFWYTQFVSDFNYMCCVHLPECNDDCNDHDIFGESDNREFEAESIDVAANFTPGLTKKLRPDGPQFVGKQEEIMGNGPIFGLYWYYEAALFVELPSLNQPGISDFTDYFSSRYSWTMHPRFTIPAIRHMLYKKQLLPPAPGPAMI